MGAGNDIDDVLWFKIKLRTFNMKLMTTTRQSECNRNKDVILCDWKMPTTWVKMRSITARPVGAPE